MAVQYCRDNQKSGPLGVPWGAWLGLMFPLLMIFFGSLWMNQIMNQKLEEHRRRFAGPQYEGLAENVVYSWTEVYAGNGYYSICLQQEEDPSFHGSIRVEELPPQRFMLRRIDSKSVEFVPVGQPTELDGEIQLDLSLDEQAEGLREDEVLIVLPGGKSRVVSRALFEKHDIDTDELVRPPVEKDTADPNADR